MKGDVELLWRGEQRVTLLGSGEAESELPRRRKRGGGEKKGIAKRR